MIEFNDGMNWKDYFFDQKTHKKMQVLNLTNVYALNHVFSPSHLPHFHTDDHVETEFVESKFPNQLTIEKIVKNNIQYYYFPK